MAFSEYAARVQLCFLPRPPFLYIFVIQIIFEQRVKSSVIKYSACFQGRLGYIHLLNYLNQLKLPNFSLPWLGSLIPSRRQNDYIRNGIYSSHLEITLVFWHILVFDFCENQRSNLQSRRIRTERTKVTGEHLQHGVQPRLCTLQIHQILSQVLSWVKKKLPENSNHETVLKIPGPGSCNN